jgi:hypothetical protein
VPEPRRLGAWIRAEPRTEGPRYAGAKAAGRSASPRADWSTCQAFIRPSVGDVRHAYGVPHLTGDETTLLAAVVGGGIAVVSTWLAQRMTARNARADARSLAIQETLAAADDLLSGVANFRTVRGPRMLRGIATGMQRSNLDYAKLPEGTNLTMAEKLVMGVMTIIGAASAGGLFDEEMERSAAHYQAMVGPPRQRLNAAVNRLTLERDRSVAGAAERLALAAARLADGASSGPLEYRRLRSTYEKRCHEFRRAAEPRRRLLRKRKS